MSLLVCKRSTALLLCVLHVLILGQESEQNLDVRELLDRQGVSGSQMGDAALNNAFAVFKIYKKTHKSYDSKGSAYKTQFDYFLHNVYPKMLQEGKVMRSRGEQATMTSRIDGSMLGGQTLDNNDFDGDQSGTNQFMLEKDTLPGTDERNGVSSTDLLNEQALQKLQSTPGSAGQSIAQDSAGAGKADPSTTLGESAGMARIGAIGTMELANGDTVAVSGSMLQRSGTKSTINSGSDGGKANNAPGMNGGTSADPSRQETSRVSLNGGGGEGAVTESTIIDSRGQRSMNPADTATHQGSAFTLSVEASIQFLNSINAPSLAKSIHVLADNTRNAQTIVQSSRGLSNSPQTRRRLSLQGPAVVTGLSGPQGRRLSTSMDTPTFSIFFCDVFGNALWKWDRKAISSSQTQKSETLGCNLPMPSEHTDICSAATISLTVLAYQSGCSRQNHPEGCDDLYHKGCSSITVNPQTKRALVSRSGGRTLGMLSFKRVNGVCQGRILDVITHYRGRKFNSPAYAEYTTKGHLYFTDSSFDSLPSEEDSNEATRQRLKFEIPFNGLYQLRDSSSIIDVVDCTMSQPNKIAFSPLEDRMYVTNSDIGDSYIRMFDISADGSIGSSKTFFNFTSSPDMNAAQGYAEGIKVDSQGNVYVIAYKTLYIFSPEATLIGTLSNEQRLYDLTIGDGQLFVTGEFGIVTYDAHVYPSTPIRQTVTDC